jgi:hypothetical protein
MTKKIVTMAEVAETQGFLKKRGSWSSLTKRAVKSITASLDMMETILESPTADEKLKASTANQLAQLSMGILEADNRDSISRMLAQVKYGGGLLGGSTVDDDNSPLICFDTIQEI